ncbi:ferredoxin [Halostagnicola kamekurae]|uniref:4Fe-4S single cluster domain-containing protein n=1 Tax=Halostagnicola kamekurae TaxID=619731 RepID=A0A1I6SGH0_9EURY|nr:ferredoxin [Halostagnicola kamekurae]SFS76062.1 4Fe-4S single cluster domain-containing protein [Halostagnicola kamekurae]
MPAYEITVEKDACDGIFACLTRDPRFVEGADGMATIDPDADPIYDCEGEVTDTAERVVATFDDDRIDEARQAAAACPTDAIVVREVGE